MRSVLVTGNSHNSIHSLFLHNYSLPTLIDSTLPATSTHQPCTISYTTTVNMAQTTTTSNNDTAREQCTCWKNLPWKSHPLFPLRRVCIATAIIGILCFWCGNRIIDYYPYDMYYNPAFAFLFSTAFCFTDLFRYAVKKARDPDTDPPWPQRRWMLVDFLLTIILQFLFWSEVTIPHYSSGFRLSSAWAVLAELLCS